MKEVRLYHLLCCYNQEAKTGASSFYFPSAFSPVDPVVTRWKLRWVTQRRHEVVTLLRETQLWQLYGLWGHGRMSSQEWENTGSGIGKASLPSSCKAPGEEREDLCSRPQRPRNAVTWARNTNRWQDTSSPWLQFQPVAVIHWLYTTSLWGK